MRVNIPMLLGEIKRDVRCSFCGGIVTSFEFDKCVVCGKACCLNCSKNKENPYWFVCDFCDGTIPTFCRD